MKIILSLVALATVAAATPVSAQEFHRSQGVSYADLDLGSSAGRKELDRRLRVAVKTACGEASAAHLKGRNEVRRCREAAMAVAQRQRTEALASAVRPSATQYTGR